MDKYRFNDDNLSIIHPYSLSYINKVDEVTRLGYDDCIIGRKEMLNDIKKTHPKLYTIIINGLRYDSKQRYIYIT